LRGIRWPKVVAIKRTLVARHFVFDPPPALPRPACPAINNRPPPPPPHAQKKKTPPRHNKKPPPVAPSPLTDGKPPPQKGAPTAPRGPPPGPVISLETNSRGLCRRRHNSVTRWPKNNFPPLNLLRGRCISSLPDSARSRRRHFSRSFARAAKTGALVLAFVHCRLFCEGIASTTVPAHKVGSNLNPSRR